VIRSSLGLSLFCSRKLGGDRSPNNRADAAILSASEVDQLLPLTHVEVRGNESGLT